MERARQGYRKAWRLFLLLPAGALTACLEKAPAQSYTDPTSLTAPVAESQPGATGNPNSSANTPPSITGKPQRQVTTGTEYHFKPVATDPDDDRLGFSIRNRPGWASFDPTTGELRGTPPPGERELVTGIVISVSDGTYGSALPPFSIWVSAPTFSGTAPPAEAPPEINNPPVANEEADPPPVDSGDTPPEVNTPPVADEENDPPPVEPENSPPVLGGAPITLAAVNELYFFEPFANDPDDDELEFAMVNKPSWLDFDTVSGVISGIPRATDVGTYSGLWLTVTDGLNVTGMGPFEIEVVAIGNNSVTLSWQAPTENEDGSPMLDLAGYRVRYGQQSKSYPNLIDINNPGIVTFGVDSLTPNTYYFVISAYNLSGSESGNSNEATITLN